MRLLSVLAGFVACAPVSDIVLVDSGDTLSVSSEQVLVREQAGATVVTWIVTHDPICNAVDDELTFQLDLTIPDLADVPLGQPIDVAAAAAPLQAELRSICFCPTPEPDPSATLTGTVQFDVLSASEASVEVDLTYVGNMAHGNAVTVTLSGPFAGPSDSPSRCL